MILRSPSVRKVVEEFGVPYGSRTRVAAVKGRCPRPLDERDAHGEQLVAYCKLVKLPYRSDAVKRLFVSRRFSQIDTDQTKETDSIFDRSPTVAINLS